MRIIGYYRLSTKEQATIDAKGSHEFQIRIAIAEMGVDDADITLLHDVMKGKRSDRPKFQEMLSLVSEGGIDVVVCRIDRLSRDAEMFFLLRRTLEKSRTKLWDLLKGRLIDFSNPDDWADYHKAGIDAEKESLVISRRTRMRNEYERSQGRVHGGRNPFGYTRNPASGVHEPNPEQWDEALDRVRLFVELRSPIAVIRVIKEKYGVEWDCNGLSKWLRSPVLRGHTPHLYRDENGKMQKNPTRVLYNTHQPLISESEAQLIDSILGIIKSQKGGRVVTIYPLSGLLFCKICDEKMLITAGRGGYCYCKNHSKFKNCENQTCTRYPLIQEAAIQAIQSRSLQLATQYKKLPVIEDSRQQSPEILELARIVAQYREFAKVDPDMAFILKKKEAELERMRSITGTTDDTQRDRRWKLLTSLSGQDARFWSATSPQELQIVMRDLVEKVYCFGSETIEVKLLI